MLFQIADSTGGLQYSASSPSVVEKVFRDIAADLQHTYLLTYKSPGPPDRNWRRIQLSVQLPGKAKISAKEGYYPLH